MVKNNRKLSLSYLKLRVHIGLTLYHKKRAHGKLKVSDKAKDYYRVGVLKSGMHTAVLKEINITCGVFSKEVILEEFEAYFEVLEREVFHEVFR